MTYEPTSRITDVSPHDAHGMSWNAFVRAIVAHAASLPAGGTPSSPAGCCTVRYHAAYSSIAARLHCSTLALSSPGAAGSWNGDSRAL